MLRLYLWCGVTSRMLEQFSGKYWLVACSGLVSTDRLVT